MAKKRIKKWCNHYSGMHMKETCDAGVRFDSLPKYRTREFHEDGGCPCFGPCGGCDKAEYPTDEEIEQNRAAMNQRISNVGVARMAIVDSLGGPWRRGDPSASGKIDCPVCKAKESLRFSRAGYNGHIHATCATEDCVSWME